MTGRRAILKAAAAGVLAGGSGLGRASADARFDLIVMGAGTAGIPTALFAARRGRVWVVEKGAVPGGTLDRSSGQVAAAGTVWQQRAGIDDSPDEHYDDIMRLSHGGADPALIRRFVGHAGPALDWLADQGFETLEGHPVTGQGHDHFLKRRYLWGEKGGWSIYQAMAPEFERQQAAGRIRLLTNTRVVELATDALGRISGVVVEDTAGDRATCHAPQVVIASGGCAANAALFHSLHGVPLYTNLAHPNAQGDGIVLGLAAGAALAGQNRYAPLPGAILERDENFPSPMAAFAPCNPTLRAPWEILVNANGQRFVQEDYPSVHHIETAIGAQPGHRHWAVFDEAMLEASPPLVEGWDTDKIRAEARKRTAICAANTLGDLAETAGLPPEALIDTVDAYNRALTEGAPDALARTHRPLPIAQPPYYAIEMRGWTVLSFAGLKVDDSLRVLRPSGDPVPGLYAAGEVIGAYQTSGQAYTNGMMVTPAITFGKLLGEEILAFEG